MKLSNKTKAYKIIAVILLVIYTLVIIFYPPEARLFQIIYVFLLLCAASAYDIVKNRIPLFLCIGVLLINAIYSVFGEWDYRIWLAGSIIILILSALFAVNKNAIGLGDVLILGFSAPAIPLDNLFTFLFLTFMLSSISGLIKGIMKRKFTGTTIPLVPCIAFSFFIVTLINSL